MDKQKNPREGRILTQWPLGVPGIIIGFSTQNPQQLRKLITLGLMPSVEVKILRKNPSWIIQTGFTHLVLDEELARCLIVQD